MNLHQDRKIFEQSIRAASEHFEILERFIEKDYWVSHVLRQLADSNHAGKLVFKGGTSLSKAYNLIDRFSEDVDIAVLDVDQMSSNQTKQLIRKVEKKITKDLDEMSDAKQSSKGSRYRKSLHTYDSVIRSEDNKIVVEISSFANPFPYETLSVQAMLGSFMEQTGRDDLANKYKLQAFKINVLSKNQTMLEKIVSLIRFSYATDSEQALSEKIRHFYDLHFLYQDKACRSFIQSPEFTTKLMDLIEHDKSAFDEPENWSKKNLYESPLISNHKELWGILSKKYESELSEYAYRAIPTSKEIYTSLKAIINILA
ncbi:MAG: nucleotidyl transferase AbiEii/AbiGii toxin family protein [Bacteroidales bacterium]